MKKIFLFIYFLSIVFSLFPQSSNQTAIYWEEISEKVKNQILSSKNADPYLIKLYQGKYNIKEDKNDKRVKSLLKTLTENRKDSLKSLYFFIFNQICLKSDGDFSEIIGGFCITYVLNNPEYAFEYFSKQVEHNNLKLFELYINFIGSELYFANDGVSESKYNYASFKASLNKYSTRFTSKQKKTLELFWKKIDVVIKNMD